MEQERIPKPGQIYRHFKNKLYQVITVATHTESGEPLVIYQALYGDFKTYARPLTMFVSEVDKIKYPESLQKYRFERVKFDGEDTEFAVNDKINTHSQVEKNETFDYNNESEKTVKQVNDEKEVKEEKEENQKNKDIVNPENIAEGLSDDFNRIQEETGTINPILLEFLEADSYQEKLEILLHRKKFINDKILNDMSVSMDCTLENGNFEDKFQGFVFCLQTYSRFEDRRLR